MEVTKKEIKVFIKPLSVNKCWCGKRFKTPDYKDYEKELLFKLPALKIEDGGKKRLEVEVGFSNKGSDLSNIIKPLEDIICKKYNIDDRYNYEILMVKKIVKKGDEYLKIIITEVVE